MRREFDEFDMLDRAATQAEYERRKRMIAEAEERNKREAEQEAKLKAIATERSLMNNRRQLKAEYQRAGVPMPFTDGDGWPIVSLSMLFKLGYRIEEVCGEKTLIKPPPEEAPKHRRTYADEGT